MGGDFNDIFKANEKLGGRSLNHRRACKLWSNLNHCNLLDLGYKGTRFTWSNNRFHNNSLIMER